MGNCVKIPDPLGDAIERTPEIDVTPLRNSKLPIIFVIGGPGAGKGTQCEMLAQKYEFLHVSSGELLRQEIQKDTKRSKIIGQIMEQGKLVPMDVVLELMKEKMMAHLDSCNGYLIDGYPREKKQGQYFENNILPVDLVIFFNVNTGVLRDRLLGRAVSSGRFDDNDVTIQKRTEEFYRYTDAVVKYYRNKLVVINGEQNVDAVFQETCAVIDDFLKISENRVHFQ